MFLAAWAGAVVGTVTIRAAWSVLYAWKLRRKLNAYRGIAVGASSAAPLDRPPP
jgi:hypothetical protein